MQKIQAYALRSGPTGRWHNLHEGFNRQLLPTGFLKFDWTADDRAWWLRSLTNIHKQHPPKRASERNTPLIEVPITIYVPDPGEEPPYPVAPTKERYLYFAFRVGKDLWYHEFWGSSDHPREEPTLIKPTFERACLRLAGKHAIGYWAKAREGHAKTNPLGLPFRPVHIRIDFPKP